VRVCVCLHERVVKMFFFISCFLSVWVLLPFDGEIKMYMKAAHGPRKKSVDFGDNPNHVT